jgi:hypothetical protein
VLLIAHRRHFLLSAHKETVITTTEQSGRKQVILAPASEFLDSEFRNVHYEPDWYERILRDIQRLRGRVYLRDGAIRPEQLSADGCHQSPGDRSSWHIVTLDNRGSAVACARLQVHAPSTRYEHLGVSRSSMAKCRNWGSHLRSAVDAIRYRAIANGARFVEAGGWALDESVRHTMEAFRIAVGAFAWSGLIGRAIGITTATFRNHSADILRDMQILSFETGGYTPRFCGAVERQADELARANVFCELPIFRMFFPAKAVRVA